MLWCRAYELTVFHLYCLWFPVCVDSAFWTQQRYDCSWTQQRSLSLHNLLAFHMFYFLRNLLLPRYIDSESMWSLSLQTLYNQVRWSSCWIRDPNVCVLVKAWFDGSVLYSTSICDRASWWRNQLSAQSSHHRKYLLGSSCCFCFNTSLFSSQHLRYHTWCDEIYSNSLVVRLWMRCCPLICIVCLTRSQIYYKLFLALCVSQPVELHIHYFCSLWFNFAIAYRIYHWIICLQWCWWLFVSHLV